MGTAKRILTAAALTTTLAACGDAETTGPEQTEGPTVSWTGCITGLGMEGALAGVFSSVLDRPEIASTETGEDGCYTFEGLPSGERLLFSWELEGYGQVVRPVRAGRQDVDCRTCTQKLGSFADIEARLAVQGVTRDPGKGLLNFTAWIDEQYPGFKTPEGYVPDIVVETSVVPSEPNETCYGNWGEGCGSAGDNEGRVRMANLDPGVMELTVVSPEGLDCTTDLPDTEWELAWDVEGMKNTFAIPIVAGAGSWVRVYCKT
jgi:hypothetical protein